ncbi:MAG: DDE-type integrase/transposase/recombinase [Planctomycetota bacterium]
MNSDETQDAVVACSVNPSHNVIRYGKSPRGEQFFFCKDCGKRLADADPTHRMWYDFERVIEALTFYYNGQSFGNIMQTFDDLHRETGRRITKPTIWRWVLQYSPFGNAYARTLRPQLGDTWLADETAFFIFKEQWWFWDLIDIDTRFLIATHLSRTRGVDKATKLFKLAKARTGMKPKTIRTDKLVEYIPAIWNAFGIVRHLRSHGFDSDENINLLERFHGTVKQRTKVMRHFKVPWCAETIMEGFITHYNFLHEHESLGGITPATAAGIGGEVESWADLIRLGQGLPIPHLSITMQNPPRTLDAHGQLFLDFEDWMR